MINKCRFVPCARELGSSESLPLLFCLKYRGDGGRSEFFFVLCSRETGRVKSSPSAFCLDEAFEFLWDRQRESLAECLFVILLVDLISE